MTRQIPRIPIIGYCDPLSVRPGEAISFKVSCTGEGNFSARILRSICADANPDGPGIVEEAVETSIAGDYPARQQAFNPGSYAIVETGPLVEGDVTLAAMIWPTLPGDGEQVILSAGGFELLLDVDGVLTDGSIIYDDNGLFIFFTFLFDNDSSLSTYFLINSLLLLDFFKSSQIFTIKALINSLNLSIIY